MQGGPRTGTFMARMIPPTGMNDLVVMMTGWDGLMVAPDGSPLRATPATTATRVARDGMDMGMTGPTGLVSTCDAACTPPADTDDASAWAPRLGAALVRGCLREMPELDDGDAAIGDIAMHGTAYGPRDLAQHVEF